MVHIIPYFLLLHFGENFMIIQSKIPKLQMHENFLKNVNEIMFSFTLFMQIFMSFYGGQLKQQICYSFILLFSYIVCNPLKMTVQV